MNKLRKFGICDYSIHLKHLNTLAWKAGDVKIAVYGNLLILQSSSKNILCSEIVFHHISAVMKLAHHEFPSKRETKSAPLIEYFIFSECADNAAGDFPETFS